MKTASGRWKCSLIIVGGVLWVHAPAVLADSETEAARLASLVRQLDALERAAEQSAEVAAAETSRYHFDYARLNADIDRIRGGIEDYLNPTRLQPRDLQPLNGQYRRQSPSP